MRSEATLIAAPEASSILRKQVYITHTKSLSAKPNKNILLFIWRKIIPWLLYKLLLCAVAVPYAFIVCRFSYRNSEPLIALVTAPVILILPSSCRVHSTIPPLSDLCKPTMKSFSNCLPKYGPNTQ